MKKYIVLCFVIVLITGCLDMFDKNYMEYTGYYGDSEVSVKAEFIDDSVYLGFFPAPVLLDDPYHSGFEVIFQTPKGNPLVTKYIGFHSIKNGEYRFSFPLSKEKWNVIKGCDKCIRVNRE